MSRSLQVCAINVYPVKSLKGIAMQSANVQVRGLENDRRYAMVGEDGEVFTQRDNAIMSTIRATVDETGLCLYGPETSIFVSKPNSDLERRPIHIWYNEALAGDCGDEAADWLSEIAGVKVRLVYFDVATERKSNKHAPDHDVSFADQYPIMVATEATLADLNSKLESAVPMNRFRPNIVVSGAEALEEDSWTSVQIGSLHFRGIGNCGRCQVTTIDQETGVKTGSEPLRTLASYRTIGNMAVFGRFLVPVDLGTIRVGDAVIVD